MGKGQVIHLAFFLSLFKSICMIPPLWFAMSDDRQMSSQTTLFRSLRTQTGAVCYFRLYFIQWECIEIKLLIINALLNYVIGSAT
ncbi:MAG: hypothetical protein RIG77_09070 [Cyclobacteriaceae bacterium]